MSDEHPARKNDIVEAFCSWLKEQQAQKDALLAALNTTADAWDELCDLLRAGDDSDAGEYVFHNGKHVARVAGRAIARCETEAKP